MSKQLLKLLDQLKTHTLKTKRLARNKRGALTELEKKIETSPYAAMLASPLRYCTFRRRIFPSKLLLRFGVGWHPGTNQLWVYPTLGKRHEYGGKGYYVSLGQNILKWVQSGLYKSIFRRADVIYRSDMADHVRIELIEDTYRTFCKYPLNKFELLTSIPKHHVDYQCILLLSPNTELFFSLHEMENNKLIPCYNISKLWSHHNIESKFNSDVIALGVPREKASVDLAVALWRCHLHLKK